MLIRCCGIAGILLHQPGMSLPEECAEINRLSGRLFLTELNQPDQIIFLLLALFLIADLFQSLHRLFVVKGIRVPVLGLADFHPAASSRSARIRTADMNSNQDPASSPCSSHSS